MSLTSGTRLGPYEIISPVGAGGMGEVYRARDTKLSRDVAVKVLPAAFAQDRERVGRFRREAQVLASLNHPNIAAIHGLEEADGAVALILEFVEGEDLAERLKRGAVPLDEALAIAKQIAEALEEAHEHGIIHRDLKPANIKVTPGGKVKVLDFGLAKAFESEGGGGSGAMEISHSPTLSRQMTEAGMIMGTAAYMSPEQARGKTVDKRSDLWAFGVVLFEMLSGERLFAGETVSDVLASVLKNEIEWSRLPPGTPGSIVRLLRRCLTRERRQRLADASDARLEIEQAGVDDGSMSGAVSKAPPPSRGATAAIALSALIAGGLLTFAAVRVSHRVEAPPISLEITGAAFVSRSSTAAISPDGSRIAFVPYHPAQKNPIMIRDLGAFTAKPLAGTESGEDPFFSPDGRKVGFFGTSDRTLMSVSLSGGTPQRLARVPSSSETGVWMADGRIVASGVEVEGARWRGLAIVPADGGAPKVLTTPTEGERAHTHPFALPGGRFVLFSVVTSDGFSIDAVSLVDGSRHRVVDGASTPQYSPGGFLVFYRPPDLTLLAARFQVETATIEGEPVVLQTGVERLVGGLAAYAISGNGTLIYTASDPSSTATGVYSLVWVDRKGVASPIVDRRDTWTQPRLSPDGRTLLVRQTASPDCSLWTLDIARGTLSRLTFRGDHHGGSWNPKGADIVSSVGTSGFRQIMTKTLDGESPERVLASVKADLEAPAISPDSRSLVFEMRTSQNGADIYAMTMDGKEPPQPFAATPFDETMPAFSPDGRYVAYESDESGRKEVYLKPFPGPGPKFQVSTDGAKGPRWSRDGKELFYASGERMVAVSVSETPQLKVSAPQVLFGGPFVFERSANYDITPDGKRFVMVQRTADDRATQLLRVVLNWSADLEKRFAR